MSNRTWLRLTMKFLTLGLLTVCLFIFSRPGYRASYASGQVGQGRIIASKPWRFEPVRIISAKSKRKGDVDIDKAFDEEDDWLDGFAVRVRNNSDKTVTAVTVEMVFRREPGDSRPPFVAALSFGPSPIGREYLQRDPNQIIRVGQSADLRLSPHNYQMIRDALEQLGYPHSIRRVEVVVKEVGFEDGSVLVSGTLYNPDPNNPNDPTKKIQANKPRRRSNTPRHHGSRTAGKSKGRLSLKRSPPSRSAQGWECYAQDWSPRSWCDANLECSTTNDLLMISLAELITYKPDCNIATNG